MKRFFATILAACIVVIGASAAADAAAVNNTPLPDIVGANGLSNPQGLSNDPQIGDCNFSSTGVVVTETTLTTFASAAEFPCTIRRGAMVDVDASGFLTIRRNGLYKASFDVNCTGVTTEVGRVTAMISTDGGTNFTQITGADAREQFLTNSLTQNMAGSGYVEVSQTAANLALNNVVVVIRGSSSAAGDMTCANGGGLRLERMDTSQPVTYP